MFLIQDITKVVDETAGLRATKTMEIGVGKI